MKLQGVEGYWAARHYKRLKSKSKKKGKTLRLGQHGKRPRRFFKIKISPALTFLRRRLLSPRRLLVLLRDAYVKMMTRISTSPAIIGAGGFGLYGDGAAAPFGRSVRREYDEKVLLQIYKTLVLQGKLNPASTNGGGEIIRA